MGTNRVSMGKRLREQKQLERKQEKEQRRAQRRAEKRDGVSSDESIAETEEDGVLESLNALSESEKPVVF